MVVVTTDVPCGRARRSFTVQGLQRLPGKGMQVKGTAQGDRTRVGSPAGDVEGGRSGAAF
jgi:hypothetical protein